jgi:hypothetical protein
MDLRKNTASHQCLEHETNILSPAAQIGILLHSSASLARHNFPVNIKPFHLHTLCSHWLKKNKKIVTFIKEMLLFEKQCRLSPIPSSGMTYPQPVFCNEVIYFTVLVTYQKGEKGNPTHHH